MTKELVKAIEVFNKRNNKAMESAVQEYEKALEEINSEMLRVTKRKEEAQINVDELRDKLGLNSIDVLTVEDDTKRKDFLGRKRKLKEQLEEEELYLHMNIDAYRERLVDKYNLEQLKQKAQAEFRAKESDYKAHKEIVEEYLKSLEDEQRKLFGLGSGYSRASTRHNHHTKKINEYKRRREGRKLKENEELVDGAKWGS